MKSYHVVNADFVEIINEEQADLSLLPVNKVCKSGFVELVKHTTGKELEGSSQRVRRGISVIAYSSIKCDIKPNMNMIVNNIAYGNLEVSEIVGSKTKVKIEAWA